ncbi:hypothetical protein [Prescottella subtropica]|uniref:hypothetical protein n=1 Tax=Prescottella subtropica TaxID=2545757 RepID=UPI0010F64EFA|nr:hypothetical protein [Prescottella subtropica]
MTIDSTVPAPPPTAVATNRAGTVTVRATETGLPVGVRIDRRELRFGGTELARQLLVLCRDAGRDAGAQRRDRLVRDGVPAELLDRLGLPTHDDVAAADRATAADVDAPASWMRPA